METSKINAMREHCDLLTKDGRELSVTWDGGSDNGYFYLNIDDEEIENPTKIELEILHFVETDLGYGSFAGDFSTCGKVTYDRECKCFVGEDCYSEADQATLKCVVDIHIPEEIWFDGLAIEVLSAGFDDSLETQVSLQISNGPYPEAFDAIQSTIEKRTNEQLQQAVNDIEHFAGLEQTFILPRKDFEARGGLLCSRIQEIWYTFSKTDTKDIYIEFSE